MRATRISVSALFACAICAASCTQEVGPDPAGEAQEASYEGQFRFVVIVRDDGEGVAGGWQEARTTLKFVDARHLFPNYWQCPITVGVPIRSSARGPISAEEASKITAKIATLATGKVMRSRERWIAIDFCPVLYDEMIAMFSSRYQLGATVTR